MPALKEMNRNIAEMKNELKFMSTQISSLSSKLIVLSSHISESMDSLTQELKETNSAIRDSLTLTSNAIIGMSETFSKTLDSTMDKMTNMSIQMNLKDTVLKSLGLDGLIPNFLKKK